MNMNMSVNMSVRVSPRLSSKRKVEDCLSYIFPLLSASSDDMISPRHRHRHGHGQRERTERIGGR
jgi:hypothetical protein